ncbi:MAG: HAD family hydrolase [Henriciella sp.]|nr:HAD family hydrolase [Henriciella sp.]
MDRDSKIEHALKRLRENEHFLPSVEFINFDPVSTPLIALETLDVGEVLEAAIKQVGDGLELSIAVDLDDTLLFGSHTCPEIWDFAGGYRDPNIRTGFQYSRLRHSWRGRIAKFVGRPEFHCVDNAQHAFMNVPRVIVAPNIPLLSTLAWLKEKGATIGLATASSKERIEYLFKRLPILSELFAHRVMTATQLAERSVIAAEERATIESGKWARSMRVHQERPFSILTKTPWALSPLFEGKSYDLILDDSATMADLFTSAGLGDLVCKPVAPFTGNESVWGVIKTCLCYISSQQRNSGEEIAYIDLPSPIEVRIEDPLYWPYLHFKDQISWGVDA